MKIYIGADHRGYKLKQQIIELLHDLNQEVVDLGTDSANVACDYPEISYKVACEVAKNRKSRGILVCMTGIGHSIAANKVHGVYAALCYNREAAVLSREHNNSNVLILGSKFVSEKELCDIVKVWMKTEFSKGRHARRVGQIKAIEKDIEKEIRNH